jgi:hypothetical protein
MRFMSCRAVNRKEIFFEALSSGVFKRELRTKWHPKSAWAPELMQRRGANHFKNFMSESKVRKFLCWIITRKSKGPKTLNLQADFNV